MSIVQFINNSPCNVSLSSVDLTSKQESPGTKFAPTNPLSLLQARLNQSDPLGTEFRTGMTGTGELIQTYVMTEDPWVEVKITGVWTAWGSQEVNRAFLLATIEESVPLATPCTKIA